MYKVKHYVNNQALRILYHSLINSRAQWDYRLGNSSFMSFTANIGCFKPRHEMRKHK